jgi:hypothetical protein
MYTPDLYSDEELDQGVALVCGAYRVQWGEYGDPYYKTPTPPDIYYEYHYVFDWENAETTIKVSVDKLLNYVRSGDFLQRAYDILDNSLESVEISTLPVIEPGDTEATTWYLVTLDGINVFSPDLDTATWKAVGIWGMENIYPYANDGYFKINNSLPAVFLIDENTYLVL